MKVMPKLNYLKKVNFSKILNKKIVFLKKKMIKINCKKTLKFCKKFQKSFQQKKNKKKRENKCLNKLIIMEMDLSVWQKLIKELEMFQDLMLFFSLRKL